MNTVKKINNALVSTFKFSPICRCSKKQEAGVSMKFQCWHFLGSRRRYPAFETPFWHLKIFGNRLRNSCNYINFARWRCQKKEACECFSILPNFDVLGFPPKQLGFCAKNFSLLPSLQISQTRHFFLKACFLICLYPLSN